MDPSAAVVLIKQWIAENPVGFGNGWEPYPISLRVVNWVKWMRKNPSLAGEEIVNSIDRQVRWLLPRLEYHLLANHLLANAKALVFAGKHLKNDGWLKKGLSIYRKELPEQVLSDGVHFELSPMYHSIMLEDVLDCYALTDMDLFRDYASRMIAGLDLLTGPDGRISKFNDSADGIAKSPKELTAYAQELGIAPARDSNEDRGASGFLRKVSGDYTLIAKMGDIGPRYQPGHAHADTYSFELWRGVEKVVTDTGTDRYVVDDERKRQRGTAAHNCVVVDGRDTSEVWAGHRVGRRFDHKSWTRTFDLTEQGLLGVDRLHGTGKHEVEIRFHIPSGKAANISCSLPVRREESCPICLEFGKSEEGLCVVFSGTVRLPFEANWRIW